MILIPLGVEGHEVRVPVICIGIVALCVLAFFGTWVLPETPNGPDPRQLREAFEKLEERPYLEVPPELWKTTLSERQRMLFLSRRQAWLQKNRVPSADEIAAQQEELDQQLGAMIRSSEHSPMRRWGLIPARGFKQVGFFTHMFLHFGWLHLLGNLLFFYMCGPLLEDAWGRKLFAIFYLTGGLLAALAHFLIDRSSQVPMAGASGAIAACMGAFAIRFATRKVAIGYFFIFFLKIFRGVFRWPAWLCGLLWFGNEVLTAVLTGGKAGGVAVMAHVGGFVFGASIAMGMKAVGLEKRLVGSSEADSTLTASFTRQVEEGQALLQQGNVSGARAKFEAALKASPDDSDAALALVKLDFEARANRSAVTRLELLLNRLLRTRQDALAISCLWQVWSALEVAELRPPLAFALARAAEAVGEQGAGLVEPLFARAGAAPGLVGAKALLCAAEVQLQSNEPHRAGPTLDAVLARADAAELHAKARELQQQVPAAPVIEAQTNESGLELSSDRHSGGFAAVARAARPPPTIVACVLLEVSPAGMKLRSVTGEDNALHFSKVLAVAAGVVPAITDAGAPRGVLLVDLIVGWGDATTAAVSVRLNSDSTAMSKLFPGASAAEVYGKFLSHVLEASGATALPDAGALKTGKFPRYPTSQARDAAIFPEG